MKMFLLVVLGACIEGGWPSWECNHIPYTAPTSWAEVRDIQTAWRVAKSTPTDFIYAIECQAQCQHQSNLCMGNHCGPYTDASCTVRPITLSTATVTSIKYIEEKKKREEEVFPIKGIIFGDGHLEQDGIPLGVLEIK